jgi:hypothetical protein
MVGAKAYGIFSTLISAATVGGVMAPRTGAGVPPTDIPFVGPVPVFAVGVGVLTALLVRVIVGSNDKKKLWSYNLAVTALAVIGSATFIIDHQVGPGNSFWVGGGFGAAGAGTVSLMRSRIFMAIVEGIRGGFLKGINTTATPTDDSGKSE